MSITLVNDGFSIQTIFIKGSKPCENIKALVRADGFHPKESEFNIVNVFKTGTKKDVIQLEYCRDNGDGTYELDLVIREGNFRAIVTYYVTCGVKNII